MSSKLVTLCAVIVALVLLAAAPAQAQQKFNFNLGGFMVRSEDARVAGDVIVADWLDEDPLEFECGNFFCQEVKPFNGFTFGGEWLMGLSDWLDVGVGVDYYENSVRSRYKSLTNDAGDDITQVLRLRIVPITATARFLPLGQEAAVMPYIGGGIGIFPWRYSETGEFVDTFDYSIFHTTYRDSGTAIGPVILGGIVVPFGPSFGIGGEVRWQRAEDAVGGDFLEFRDDPRIDLGGVTAQVVFQVRFGRR